MNLPDVLLRHTNTATRAIKNALDLRIVLGIADRMKRRQQFNAAVFATEIERHWLTVLYNTGGEVDQQDRFVFYVDRLLLKSAADLADAGEDRANKGADHDDEQH
jgi:hypothetical protein